jgi:copper homeostasis protein
MKNPFVLEVCVESLERATAAESGGAHRIELCADLAGGGTTPSAGLMQSVREHVRLPIHVMIRPRTGGFCYSNFELEVMRNDIQVAKNFKMDGIVLGILREDASVDVERTKMLVEFAHPLPVTFHRAFDLAENRATALEDVIETGAARILTSGGELRATDGLSILRFLMDAAKGRLRIMPCGGIDCSNITTIARTTSARELHTSVGTSNARASATNTPSNGNEDFGFPEQLAVFEQNVTELVNQLAKISREEVLHSK